MTTDDELIEALELDDGADTMAFQVGALHVQRQPGCYQLLRWRCRLDASLAAVSLRQLADQLLEAGYAERSRHPNLIELERPDGQQLVFVTTTGRIELRIGYWLSDGERLEAARSVASDLAAALESLDLTRSTLGR